MTFLYFAYGSNLLIQRLHLKNPSAKFVDVAELKGYKLTFTSFGKDPLTLTWMGGAATVLKSRQSSVWGCVYSLEMEHMKSLDKQEGVGKGFYEFAQVEVINSNGKKYSCRTYYVPKHVIDRDTHDSHPSPQYMDIILRGARQNQLPITYQDLLKSIENNGNKKNVSIYDDILQLLK